MCGLVLTHGIGDVLYEIAFEKGGSVIYWAVASTHGAHSEHRISSEEKVFTSEVVRFSRGAWLQRRPRPQMRQASRLSGDAEPRSGQR